MVTWVDEARQALMQRRSSLHGVPGGDLERLSEWERKELKDIDDALTRIQQGRFGHCARCGGAIGRHRLRAIPEARHCIACSTSAAAPFLR